MNAQLNKSKPVYFPTELWNEIKSYIPAPEPPFVRCLDVLKEWRKKVLPHLPKKVVAQRLREWSSEDTPQFNEMTDPKENRYKRTTREDLCYKLSCRMRDRIRDALGELVLEGGLYNYEGVLISSTGENYVGWNPRTNIDPAIIIAYRETYKQMKNEIKLYRQLNL